MYKGISIEKGTEKQTDDILKVWNEDLDISRVYSDEINQQKWQKIEVKSLMYACDYIKSLPVKTYIRYMN